MLIKFKDESFGCVCRMYFTRVMETDTHQGGHNRGLSLVIELTPYELVPRQIGIIGEFFAMLKGETIEKKIEEHPEEKFSLFFDSSDFHCLYDLFVLNMKDSVEKHADLFRQSEAYMNFQRQLDASNKQMLKDAEEHSQSYQ